MDGDFCASCRAVGGHRQSCSTTLMPRATPEIRWVSEVGLMGWGARAGDTPGTAKAAVLAMYDPLVRSGLRVVVNCHAGPEFRVSEDPVALAILLKEVIVRNRNLANLIYGGVFERHPDYASPSRTRRAWVVAELATLDRLILSGRANQAHFFGGDEMGKVLELRADSPALLSPVRAAPLSKRDAYQ